jgi:hypothetical protein
VGGHRAALDFLDLAVAHHAQRGNEDVDRGAEHPQLVAELARAEPLEPGPGGAVSAGHDGKAGAVQPPDSGVGFAAGDVHAPGRGDSSGDQGAAVPPWGAAEDVPAAMARVDEPGQGRPQHRARGAVAVIAPADGDPAARVGQPATQIGVDSGGAAGAGRRRLLGDAGTGEDMAVAGGLDPSPGDGCQDEGAAGGGALAPGGEDRVGAAAGDQQAQHGPAGGSSGRAPPGGGVHRHQVRRVGQPAGHELVVVRARLAARDAARRRGSGDAVAQVQEIAGEHVDVGPGGVQQRPPGRRRDRRGGDGPGDPAADVGGGPARPRIPGRAAAGQDGASTARRRIDDT